MFNEIYRGKKVLITGNTGFKGAWLTAWLLKLGADVVGVSKEIPTCPSMYEVLKLDSKIKHYMTDVRDLEAIQEIVLCEKPDFVFHLAAQAIVSTSYKDPIETITSNVVGTVNVLEVLRRVKHKCCAIIITSDKCYENVEWVWGYKETDQMGGKDIYSASKGAADLLIKSYVSSFFSDSDQLVKIATARAGNVIGGGDWAKDRVVVDCFKAWNDGIPVEIRCPDATRPWQHVLEPLSGYLTLGLDLWESGLTQGEAFNFGPKSEQNRSVLNLIHDLAVVWDFNSTSAAYSVTDTLPFNEAGLLKLNCDKALFYLKWQSTLSYHETVQYVGDWYTSFYRSTDNDMADKTYDQIADYETKAANQNMEWTK